MKLIAENSYEDQLLPGLVALLRDLKVDACGFRTEEAIAPVFWSCQDVCLELAVVKELNNTKCGMWTKIPVRNWEENLLRAGLR